MHIVKMLLVLWTVIKGKKVALKINQMAPKSKWFSTILYNRLDTYSRRQTDMTTLTGVFPPNHIQHGLHLRGTRVSDHLHASADLTLRVKHLSVPELVIQPHWSMLPLWQWLWLLHEVSQRQYELDCAATFLISMLAWLEIFEAFLNRSR
jgi:hypothetical protein